MKVFGVLAAILWTATCVGALPKKSSANSNELKGTPKFPEPKYFRESSFNIHVDARYGTKEPLKETEQRDALRVLVQTYLSTFRELGIQTWLMHGSLLGWWWGKKIMPWDMDADVQVSESDMFFLAAYYNMSTFYYKYDGVPEGRTFLLEVNPHYVHRESDDQLNVIDARWIDMSTGLFIDITAARYDLTNTRGEGVLKDKNGHEFKDTYLYPLYETTFEGAPVNIPYGYRKMLESEYGEKALTNTKHRGHNFDEVKMEWVLDASAQEAAIMPEEDERHEKDEQLAFQYQGDSFV